MKSFRQQKKSSKVLFKYFGGVVSGIEDKWNEPWRFYHTEEHLVDLLEKIEEEEGLSKKEFETLVLAAFFHDIVYLPWDIEPGSNENNSVNMFLEFAKDLTPAYSDDGMIKDVCTIIKDTAPGKVPKTKLSKIFHGFDNSIVTDSMFLDLIAYEKKIFKEYQIAAYSAYRAGRLQFLSTVYDTGVNKEHIGSLISYVEGYVPRIGVYPGSFNPFHKGHLNVLEKAEKIFDKVIIMYGRNPGKNASDVFDREKDVPEQIAYREVDFHQGLLVDYIEKVEAMGVDVTLIRGLRNGNDLDYESSQVWFNEKLKGDLKVVYIPCDQKYEHISSSRIRDLQVLKGDERIDKLLKEILP